MAYDTATLRKIYDRTDGYCHICNKRLSLTNYGLANRRGGWEVEHSRARSNGGTDHLNNLYAACICCNREKRCFTTRTARGWNGRTKAPLSKSAKSKARTTNTIGGAVVGGFVGALGGPIGVLVGTAVGAFLGNNAKPE